VYAFPLFSTASSLFQLYVPFAVSTWLHFTPLSHNRSTETFAIAPVESVGHHVGGGGFPLMLFHPAENKLAGIPAAVLVAISLNVAALYPAADTVTVTLFAESGNL
jgi:hypothetical protein